MGQPTEPITSPTRAATPPDQKTIDADRTEIIVLAIGILFLVSQLVLIIWLFAPRAFPRRPREQRTIGWRPVNPDLAAQNMIHSDDDSQPSSRRHNYRRRSTWNGCSVTMPHDGHLVRRRNSSGLKPAGLRTSSSSNPDSDSPDRDNGKQQGLQDTGLAAASLAYPMVPLLPRPWRSPFSSQEPELTGSIGDVREMSMSPATFSPRSPRLGPVNMMTISAIIKANKRKSGTMPVSSSVVDETDLAGGFDDPLGANRRGRFSGNNNSVLIDERPRERRRSDETLLSSDEGVPTRGERHISS